MKERRANVDEQNRTEYSAKNTSMAIVCQIVAILVGYITRIVFTHTLSATYVGINGLFMNIFNALTLAGLGLAPAITYALYQPIAAGDIEKQKAVLKLIQLFFRRIALILFGIGIILIPTIPFVVNNAEGVSNLTLIYVMYLLNAVLSYVFIYKRLLMDAYQLSYIGLFYQTAFIVVQDIVQIIILVATKNFLLYLSMYLVFTLITNIVTTRRTERMYPYLKEPVTMTLPESEKKDMFSNVRAMMMQKLGAVLINDTDNILVSALAGIVSVGKYSNYYLLITSVNQILERIFFGITASVGNLGATSNISRVKKIFETSFFIGQWIYGFAAICLYELLSPFVAMSLGKQFLFEDHVVFILCINFYVMGMRKATQVFRDSLGIFRQDRYKVFAEFFINLVVSVLLAPKYGAFGIFFGALVSVALTSVWLEPYVLYKYHLKTPVRNYFGAYAFYAAVLAIAWYATDALCVRIPGGYFQVIVLRLLVCLIVPNVIMLVFYCRKKEFLFAIDKMKTVLNVRRR